MALGAPTPRSRGSTQAGFLGLEVQTPWVWGRRGRQGRWAEVRGLDADSLAPAQGRNPVCFFFPSLAVSAPPRPGAFTCPVTVMSPGRGGPAFLRAKEGGAARGAPSQEGRSAHRGCCPSSELVPGHPHFQPDCSEVRRPRLRGPGEESLKTRISRSWRIRALGAWASGSGEGKCRTGLLQKLPNPSWSKAVGCGGSGWGVVG